MAEHSPLPWHLGPYYRFDIHAPGGLDVAGGFPRWSDQGEANAAFIVRACNSHYELIAALKEMRELSALCFRVIAKAEIQELFADEYAASGIANGAGVRAQAAIAKAEATHEQGTPNV